MARHIIMQFVAKGPVVEREEFNYRRSLPNIVTMRLAPEYWIASTNGFTHKQGPERLSAHIGQVTSAVLLRSKDTKITDIRPVLAQVEEIMPDLQDPEQRLPLLTLYFLFHQWAGPDFSREQWPALFEKYKSDFDHPSTESFVAHLLTGQPTHWTLEQFEELHRTYFKTRHRAGVTHIGRLLEAAFSLYVAEINRKAGDETRSRELIGLAVDAHPSHGALRAFEAALTSGPLPEIFWEKILLPPPQPKLEPPAESDTKTT